MACEAVRAWSLTGLVAAFLDLVIAYLLLCALAVAYLASQFLGFFGLSLPCPCDGAFLNPNSKILCLNKVLVDFPTRKVLNVQLSAKQGFPFGHGGDGRLNEMESDGSYSPVRSRKEKYDVKGKWGGSHRARSRSRQRKRSVSGGGGGQYGHLSNKGGNRFAEGVSLPVESDADMFLEYDSKVPPTTGARQMSMREMNQSPDENTNKKIHIEDLQGFQSLDGDEKNTVRLLEQKLEEERITCASLYIELEKERSAATSAAEEAMAMILRLQEEKAHVEMDARQYQRILEEKSAYDTEEMNILQEILMKREKENLFLEKEVEAYRQAISLGDNGTDKISPPTDKSQNEPRDLELQEKEIISTNVESRLGSKVLDECKKPVPEKGLKQIQNKNEGSKLAEKIIETCDGNDMYCDTNTKQEVKKSSLERTYSRLPLIKSLSGVESEMLKIDCEIARLRERLKLVQDGRGKLSLSSESRESGNVQLNLLEDITRQVQEIRQLSKTGETLRRVSLPLPTPKIMSKKRRSRSASSKRSSEGMISS